MWDHGIGQWSFHCAKRESGMEGEEEEEGGSKTNGRVCGGQWFNLAAQSEVHLLRPYLTLSLYPVFIHSFTSHQLLKEKLWQTKQPEHVVRGMRKSGDVYGTLYVNTHRGEYFFRWCNSPVQWTQVRLRQHRPSCTKYVCVVFFLDWIMPHTNNGVYLENQMKKKMIIEEHVCIMTHHLNGNIF